MNYKIYTEKKNMNVFENTVNKMKIDIKEVLQIEAIKYIGRMQLN